MCEVYVLNDLIYQVRLQKIDLPVREGINVDANIIVEVLLIFHVKIESYICDYLVDLSVAWGGKDAIVNVENEYNFVLI